MYIKDDYEVKEKTDLVAEIQQSVENLEKIIQIFIYLMLIIWDIKSKGC